ncbi:MAG: photosystem I reaction center subunit IV [Gammaproteobacteria bacterium]|nr:photosystem I reaction center subunit IV [Gammaproteobacteria bacterium]
MKHWARWACVLLGAGLMSMSATGAEEGAGTPAAAPKKSGVVVDIRTDRILLLDIVAAGNRLVAVGERGFTMVSDDQGKSWKAIATPVTRTLTGVAFKDAKVGVAVGHGASVVRTEDGGNSWTHVPLPEAEPESLLGVTNLGGDHFIAYGAFGMYFDSADAGKTWQKRMVVSEDFDRHISQVIPVGNSLFMVAESGTLARSDDGGQTWTAMTSPYEGSYFAALQTRDGALLAFGMRGNVYRTTDFGANWTKIPLDTTASLMGGKQLSDGRILLVGNVGLLAVSKDDGQTLELHWAPGGRGYSQLVEAGGRIILVGEAGISELDPAWLTGTTKAAGQ